MQSLYDGLTGIGVREDRIHYESFGPATVLKSEAKPEAATESGPSARVRFSKSGAAAEWSRGKAPFSNLRNQLG